VEQGHGDRYGWWLIAIVVALAVLTQRGGIFG
jgi:hypothetical protein